MMNYMMRKPIHTVSRKSAPITEKEFGKRQLAQQMVRDNITAYVVQPKAQNLSSPQPDISMNGQTMAMALAQPFAKMMQAT